MITIWNSRMLHKDNKKRLGCVSMVTCNNANITIYSRTHQPTTYHLPIYLIYSLFHHTPAFYTEFQVLFVLLRPEFIFCYIQVRLWAKTLDLKEILYLFSIQIHQKCNMIPTEVVISCFHLLKYGDIRHESFVETSKSKSSFHSKPSVIWSHFIQEQRNLYAKHNLIWCMQCEASL